MAEENDTPVSRRNLQKKLAVVWKAFGALSSGELQYLVEHPNQLEQLLSATRMADRKPLNQKQRDAITTVNSPTETFNQVVHFTREQREEERRLTLEIWEKQGIAEQMMALSKIRGQRLDPFAQQDPEPTSDQEE